MTGVVWWLVERASALLDAEERDAVRGDLAELNVAAGRALREVVGLLVRRQLRLWTDWRPWLALAGLVIPLGMLLSLISRQWANTNSIYAWLYVDNWTWKCQRLGDVGLVVHIGRRSGDPTARAVARQLATAATPNTDGVASRIHGRERDPESLAPTVSSSLNAICIQGEAT